MAAAVTRHGHVLGYRVDGCRCKDCTAAANKYAAKLQLRHARGEVWVDGSDIDIPELRKAGIAAAVLAKVAGTGRTSSGRALAGKGRVRADIADRLNGLGLDDMPDTAKVGMDLMRSRLQQLRDQGDWNDYRIACDVFGWPRWPGDVWLHQDRVTLRLVRKVDAVLAECGRCGGAKRAWQMTCKPCFDARTLPTDRHELDVLHRRREARDRKRKERAVA